MKISRNRVTPKRDANGNIIYVVRNYNTSDSVLTPDLIGNPDAIIQADDMLHIRNMGDGLVGWSVIKLARESIGLTLAAENSGSSFFGNSSLPSGVLESPNKMTPEALKNLRESWDRLHKGKDNRHKIAILEQGMKFNPMSISPDDAQFLETRQFQVEDVARWFRMPPHKIGNLARATGWSTLEATNTDYIVDTLMPWTERWEQEIQRKLLTEAEKPTLFCEFLFDALLRGDSAARSAFYTSQVGIGAMSPNDVREAENRNPTGPEGDTYFVSTQYQTLDAAVNPPEPAPQPAIGAPPASEADAMAQRKLDSVHYHHRAMLKAAFERVLTLEMDKIQRMSSKSDFAKVSEEFYRDHAFYVRDAVSGIFTSYVASAWAILSDATADEQQRDKILAEIIEICGNHAKKSLAECRNAEAVATWKTRAETQAHDTLTHLETFLKRLTKGSK